MSFSRLINPTDDAWRVRADLWIVAHAAVDRDTCVFAAHFLNAPDETYESYSRFYRYSKGYWVCAEIPARIVSMTPYRELGWSTDGLAVLGEDGDIWFLGEHGYQTRVDNSDARILSQIKVIDGKLFVAGHHGQLYRRDLDGWRHDDQGLLDKPPPRYLDRGRLIAVVTTTPMTLF